MWAFQACICSFVSEQSIFVPRHVCVGECVGGKVARVKKSTVHYFHVDWVKTARDHQWKLWRTLFLFRKNSVTYFGFINQYWQRVIFCSAFTNWFAYSSFGILENVKFMWTLEAFFSEGCIGTFWKFLNFFQHFLAKFAKCYKVLPLKYSLGTGVIEDKFSYYAADYYLGKPF